MESVQIRVEARIHFLSDEAGGRTTSLRGGGSYCPNHNFFGPDSRDMCIGFIDLAEGEHVAPGDTIYKTITLLGSPSLKPELKEGREWRIQEGPKLVAIGIILRILDLPS
jgi:translation elongation factor EF-Tu-like GTPase